MRVEERFLKYVAVDTQSDEASMTSPSTEKQLVLAQMLADELKELGLEDAHVDAFGVVYAKLSANAQGFPAIECPYGYSNRSERCQCFAADRCQL